MEALKPRRTPRKRKMEVIAHLHRHRLQHTTVNAREWMRHHRALKKELWDLNRRIVALWLQGAYKDRDTRSLVTRIAGLRQRVQANDWAAPSSRSIMWQDVTVSELEQLELYLSNPSEEGYCVPCIRL